MSAAQGLSPNDIVNVSVSLSAAAVQGAGLGTLLIVGTTPQVIDIQQRVRTYLGSTILTQVAADFGGTTAPEYLAAVAYCGQVPQPQSLQIARWAKTATLILLYGAPLTAAQQSLTAWNAITNGSFSYTSNSVTSTVTGVNLSTATSLGGAAPSVVSLLNAAITAGNLSFQWFPGTGRFGVNGNAGASAALSFLSAAGAGTDLSAPLMMQAANAPGAYIVPGVATETPLAAIQACRAASSMWYAAHFATNVNNSDEDTVLTPAALQAVGAAVLGFGRPSLLGVTVQEPASLLSTSTTDTAAVLNAANNNRIFTMYSSTSGFAACSFFGRAATVDFTGANTAITMKFQNAPGIAAEVLTEAQYAALAGKKCNAFVQYNDGLAIIQEGVMADGTFFDEIQNIDWMAQAVQTACINTLAQAGTKVPQTDAGMHVLLAAVDAVMAQGVANGVVGPGLAWQGGNVGALVNGQIIPSGWYIYQQLIAQQSPAARGLRQGTLMQVCFNFAGAVHSQSVQISVVR